MSGNLKLINAEPEFWEFIRKLRTDHRVMHGFLTEKYISSEDQKEYMGKYSDNYFVALYDGSAAGYIGVLDDDIRVCTHPDFQGRGVGTFMLKEIGNRFPRAYGRIKRSNISSQKAFNKAGVFYRIIDG